MKRAMAFTAVVLCAACLGPNPLRPSTADAAPAALKPPKPIVLTMAGCSSTGWKLDNAATAHTTTLNNPAMQSTPAAMTIYFSPGGDNNAVVYPITWSWEQTTSSNPVTIEVTASRVNLQITGTGNLHGVWNPINGWTKYPTGYWAVVACK